MCGVLWRLRPDGNNISVEYHSLPSYRMSCGVSYIYFGTLRPQMLARLLMVMQGALVMPILVVNLTKR